MHSRWYNVTVVGLWLASMSWLLAAKVLPPLLTGEPPNYRAILAAQEDNKLVGWKLSLNERPLGWAVSVTQKYPDNTAEIRSRVMLEKLPLDELVSGLLGEILRRSQVLRGSLQMDAQSNLMLDAQGKLKNFDSLVHLEPLGEVIRLEGAIEGPQMSLSVRAGGSWERKDLYFPTDGLLGDEMSPQVCLPNLHPGRTWKVPSINPLRPNNPVELLEAKVEGLEPLAWSGQTEDVWLVVIRPEGGSSSGFRRAERGRLWVRRDGTVVKQQTAFFNALLTFERLPDEQAARLAERLRQIDQQEAARRPTEQ
jgi:hypothetical protein